MRRRLRRWGIAMTVMGGGVFLLAGRLTDPWLWAYVGAWAVLFLYAMLALDDDLAKERFSPPEPGADRVSLRAVRLIALAHVVAGAVDSGRLQLTPIEPGLRILGLVGMSISSFVVFHAMRSNRFFSSVVRIQSDRGHHVIDKGPYAIVRHPGYAGMIVMAPLSGLALGSWISVALAAVYSALILRRVLFEDAFLRRNLEGYVEYAHRVRYRLVPGVF